MAVQGANNVNLPDALLAEVEETAKAEKRAVADVLSDAVRRYLDERKWQKLVDAGEQRAKEKGISEADVPGLVEEARREKQTRER